MSCGANCPTGIWLGIWEKLAVIIRVIRAAKTPTPPHAMIGGEG
jgi:hypothetical protein